MSKQNEATKKRSRDSFDAKEVSRKQSRRDRSPEDGCTSAKEPVEWLPKHLMSVPVFVEMNSWMLECVHGTTPKDDATFCDEATNEGILDSQGSHEMVNGCFFRNKTAMIMANIDSVLGNLFTHPKDGTGNQLVPPGDLLFFADIGAGGAGFSEYILWKKGWMSKGFGFRGRAIDFTLDDSAAAPELLRLNIGDICRAADVTEFQKSVMSGTGGGVHIVVADGAFPDHEKIRDISSKRRLLCQLLCALNVLRPGGNFVCKVWDLRHHFHIGLVYLMYRCFGEVAIMKPATSYERYVICKDKQTNCVAVQLFLNDMNDKMARIEADSPDGDVAEIIPLAIMREDKSFFDYITIQQRKVFSDPRDFTAKSWGIPDKVEQTRDQTRSASHRFRALTKESEYKFRATVLYADNLEEMIKSVYNYRCMVAGSKQRFLMLSLGKSDIYKWDLESSDGWKKVDDIKIEIPSNSILDVEFVEEYQRDGKHQKKNTAIHVFDALFLAGVDVRRRHFNERIEQAKIFLRAISRPSDVPIRVKTPVRLEQIERMMLSLKMKSFVQVGKVQKKLCFSGLDDDSSRYFIPTGVYLVKICAAPWMVGLSRTQQKKYFYNTKTKQSVFETTKNCIASYEEAARSQLVWKWDESTQMLPEKISSWISIKSMDINQLTKSIFVDFIHEKTSPPAKPTEIPIDRK